MLAAVSISSNSSSKRSCQQSQQPQEEIVHIVCYPNLDARLQFAPGLTANTTTTTDDILSYHVQKLQEVGYRNIEIVNSRETTVNLTNAQTNETVSTVPAKIVDMKYVTNFAPDDTRTGYFILTATNATAPNPGMTKGYSVFYEGKSTATATTNGTSILQTTTSNNLPSPLSAQVRQIFDSFELIAAEEQGVTQTVDGGGENDIGDFDTVDFDTVDGGGEEEEEPTNLLTVDIISNGTEGIAPATFEFQADITGGTEPYTISWDFDDDDGSSEASEDDEQDVVHTFDEAGTYNVTLTITDSEDLTASGSIEITIEEQQLSLAEEEQEEAVCDSSYPDLCIPAPPPDLDCGDHGVPENFQVLPPDRHGFDSDNDGIGCDSESNQAELEREESSPNDDPGPINGGKNPNDDDGDNNATADDDEDA